MLSVPRAQPEAGLDDVAVIHNQLQAVVVDLRGVREAWRRGQKRHLEYGAHGFPARPAIERVVDTLASALFPIRLGSADLVPESEDAFVEAALKAALRVFADQLRKELAYNQAVNGGSPRIALEVARILAGFVEQLPEIRRLLDTDLEAAYIGDPAARSVDEVLLCYPCVVAIIHHRLAHALHRLGAPLVARIMAEIAHSRTGIDIHPGATIGESFFIDHGTGVVIGETAEIGNRVRIYQAVTLGARSFATDPDGSLVKGAPRHPIIEDDVTIYAGATILGRVTIGAGSVIGGNVWLTRSIPAGSRVRQTRPSIDIETVDPFD